MIRLSMFFCKSAFQSSRPKRLTVTDKRTNKLIQTFMLFGNKRFIFSVDFLHKM